MPRVPPPAALSDRLAAIVAEEGALEERVLRQLGRAGITEVDVSDPPEVITAIGPRYRITADINREHETPIASALAEVIDEARAVDSYMRLALAAADMEVVAEAATELARFRPRPGSSEPRLSNVHARIEDVAESGLVVVYARSFTGNASLSRDWWPESEDDRKLHHQLMAMRDEVHAHADHTTERTMIPGTTSGGIAFSQMLAFNRMWGDELRDVAGLAERQQARFKKEADRLYELLALSQSQ